MRIQYPCLYEWKNWYFNQHVELGNMYAKNVRPSIDSLMNRGLDPGLKNPTWTHTGKNKPYLVDKTDRTNLTNKNSYVEFGYKGIVSSENGERFRVQRRNFEGSEIDIPAPANVLPYPTIYWPCIKGMIPEGHKVFFSFSYWSVFDIMPSIAGRDFSVLDDLDYFGWHGDLTHPIQFSSPTGRYSDLGGVILPKTHTGVIDPDEPELDDRWAYFRGMFTLEPGYQEYDEIRLTWMDICFTLAAKDDADETISDWKNLPSDDPDHVNDQDIFKLNDLQLIDVTEIYGAGNEPSTAHEFWTRFGGADGTKYYETTPSVSVPFTKEQTFDGTSGIGYLTDCLSCNVVEERNGAYDLTMTYPMTGMHYDDIIPDRIIVAKPNLYDDPQPFRIKSISKPLNGTVTINAEHISYDMSDIPLPPFSAPGLSSALDLMSSLSKGIVLHDFEFSYDPSITTADKLFFTEKPMSLRAALGGDTGSILEQYGGEFKFDWFDVRLMRERGSDKNLQIFYGGNLTDLSQEENIEEAYNYVYPYWYQSSTNDAGATESVVVYSMPKLVPAKGTYDHTKILVLDMTSEFDAQPTEQAMYDATVDYIERNKVGVPKISMTLKYNPDVIKMDDVELGDTVHVHFSKLGINATARIIKTDFNVLLNRYDSVDVGEPQNNFAGTVHNAFSYVKDLSTVVNKTVAYNTKITQLANQLGAAIESTNGDVASINGWINSEEGGAKIQLLTQTVDDMQQLVIGDGGIDATLGSLNSKMQTVENYIHIRSNAQDATPVITVGTLGNDTVKFKITKNAIGFTTANDDSEFDTTDQSTMGYFSNQEFHAGSVTGATYLQIGETTDTDILQDWRFIRDDSNGDLIFQRI